MSDRSHYSNGQPRRDGMPARIEASTLATKPTLSVGQDADLKIDTGQTRYWLSRCGIADGMPCDNMVSVERLADRGWVNVLDYCGDTLLAVTS